MNSDDFKDRDNESSQAKDGIEITDSTESSDNRSDIQEETDTPIEQIETRKIQVQGNPDVDAYVNGKVQGNTDADVYVNGKSEPGNHLYSGLYAGFWTRFWAYLLDLIVIGSINRMIINPVFRALDVSLIEDGIFSPVSIATAIVFYLYFVLMTKYLGQTLGKMVFGLKVVELDGKGLTWGTVIFREWIGRFISATIMVLYVVVAFTKKKQGLHDLFADTTVIYEPR
jgi:uncharacterized RDD family membrane protein YckC